jgi:hypothetical protein
MQPRWTPKRFHDGLFRGQSAEFLQLLHDLASDAHRAKRDGSGYLISGASSSGSQARLIAPGIAGS